MSVEGGFCGRSNKLVVRAHEWWFQLASLGRLLFILDLCHFSSTPSLGSASIDWKQARCKTLLFRRGFLVHSSHLLLISQLPYKNTCCSLVKPIQEDSRTDRESISSLFHQRDLLSGEWRGNGVFCWFWWCGGVVVGRISITRVIVWVVCLLCSTRVAPASTTPPPLLTSCTARHLPPPQLWFFPTQSRLTLQPPTDPLFNCTIDRVNHALVYFASSITENP